MKTIIIILSLAPVLLGMLCNQNNCVQNNSNVLSKDVQSKKETSIIPQKDTSYQIIKDIPVPKAYKRADYDKGTYADFLRNLPIKQENNTVMLFNGAPKYNQNAQFAVLKIDVGNQDLQQCADAVMRLRAEFLYKKQLYNQIHFNFISDSKPRYYTDYCKGDYSYKKFRKYMDYIFCYANTASLRKELKQIKNLDEISIGDVFIQIGNPYGHAVIVVDLAIEENSGKKIFMIAQSYMPAQEIHILKNPTNINLSPWYEIEFGEELITPEWIFTKNDLHRF